MSIDCVISFDHPDGVYNCGSTLNGHIKLRTSEIISIRGISIRVLGYGKIFWNESSGKNSTKYKSHEQYLNSVTYAVGCGEVSFDLHSGINEYTFTCQLPIQLVSSMSEAHCKVKYKILVTIVRRFRFDTVFKKEFKVNHITDLNIMEISRLPRKILNVLETPAIFSLLCYDDGETKAELEIGSDGYLTGQEIQFKLIIYNNSNFNVSEAKVKLLQCFTLQSTEPSVKEKEFQNELVIKPFTGVRRYSKREFIDSLYIPNVPPTQSTNFIKLDYKISSKISVGYMKKFYVEVPLTIGTIPLSDIDTNESINASPMAISSDGDSMTSMRSTAVMLPNRHC